MPHIDESDVDGTRAGTTGMGGATGRGRTIGAGTKAPTRRSARPVTEEFVTSIVAADTAARRAKRCKSRARPSRALGLGDVASGAGLTVTASTTLSPLREDPFWDPFGAVAEVVDGDRHGAG
jgi:hypothetical protein